ncbi:1391_t:CDS:2, partial [Cetraspora pellucida]
NAYPYQNQEPLYTILKEIIASFEKLLPEFPPLPIHLEEKPTLEQKLKIALGYLYGVTANWYDGVKKDLEYWDNKYMPTISFIPLFIQYFATPKHKHKWQIDLNVLFQKKNKLHMFLGGLKAKIALWLSIAEPPTLKEVIEGARKIKAREYY